MAITTMSSKGQIVIPMEMRENISEGEQLVVIKTKGQLIMKKVSELNENFAEDLDFAKRTEAALQRYEKGLCQKRTFEEFSKELDLW